MSKKQFKPESLMMSYGYKPELSQGSVKCPVFQTSTFVFEKAEDGKAFFELAYGLRELEENEESGLIYSRLNNPDLQILEERLTLWDDADAGAVFESGMAAISTCLMEFLQPGDLLLYSNPVYGGTDHFINHVLTKFGVHVLGFYPGTSKEDIIKLLESSGKADKLAMIHIETPANPTNDLIDIQACAEIAQKYSTEERKAVVSVDNTFLGPLWQNPLELGADMVMYSATKYIGGHSDLLAGAVIGSNEIITRVKTLRTFLGNMCSPHTGWMLMRSLETLKIRMEQQARNAKVVAEYLKDHPKVAKVHYLGFENKDNPLQQAIFDNQCKSAGAMVAFDIKGGEKEAFTFLNNLTIMKLAVSLGGTESLAQHPCSMTHAGVAPETKVRLGISDQLVRLSIGVENADDLVWDVENALEKV